MSSTTSPVAGGQGADTSRRSFSSRQIAAGILLALVAVVIAQNRERVEVTLLFFELRAPLWLTLTGTALVGAVIGQLLVRRRAKARRR
jgi:lipopolysaccharide assembly protein A